MPPTNTPFPLNQDGKNVLLFVSVKTNAKKNALIKIDRTAVHVTIKAAPKQGAANAALIDFFSEILSLPSDSIILKKGHTFHKKVLLLKNCSLTDILAVLEKNTQGS